MPETRTGSAEAPRVAPAIRRLAAMPSARVAAAVLAPVAAVLALVEPLLPLDLSRRLAQSSLGVGVVLATGLVA